VSESSHVVAYTLAKYRGNKDGTYSASYRNVLLAWHSGRAKSGSKLKVGFT